MNYVFEHPMSVHRDRDALLEEKVIEEACFLNSPQPLMAAVFPDGLRCMTG